MPKRRLKVLIVEDDENHAALIKAMVDEIGSSGSYSATVDHVLSAAEAVVHLESTAYQICLLDYHLGSEDGLSLLRAIRAKDLSVPVIFLTAMGDEEVAVEAMKSGATDYIRKGNLSADLLAASIKYSLEVHENEAFRKQAQEALRKANEELEARVVERTSELQKAYAELQGMDRMKTEMIQNISHEFRTPMGYIVGYIDLLLVPDRSMGPLTEEQQRSLEIVAQQSRKLTRLIDNFVSIQRLEAVSPTKEPVGVKELLEEAVAGAKLNAAERGIALALALEEGLPSVMIDHYAMSQVLDNLLANALKFTDEGGKVSVRAWPDRSKDRVNVSVTDTGMGIPDAMLERIFERFFQIDGTATRKFGGVGLGLAVCKQIVEAHGERIWVESKAGEGATFTFTMKPVS
jgi:signal transduction histidine kinase